MTLITVKENPSLTTDHTKPLKMDLDAKLGNGIDYCTTESHSRSRAGGEVGTKMEKKTNDLRMHVKKGDTTGLLIKG